MPTTRKRIVIATLLITCLLGAAVLFSRYGTAPVIAIPENMDPELDGRASFDNEGRMSVTIVNNTMNGGDCLIAQGRVEVVTRYRDDSKYVLRIRIWPTIERTQLSKISVSPKEENLLDAGQMLRFEIRIPGEYEDGQYEAVDVDMEACLTPIQAKVIDLKRKIVRLKVPTRSMDGH